MTFNDPITILAAAFHEEVIEEVIIGRNVSPSAALLRKLIELHRSVRRELYEEITKKVTVGYLTAA